MPDEVEALSLGLQGLQPVEPAHHPKGQPFSQQLGLQYCLLEM